MWNGENRTNGKLNKQNRERQMAQAVFKKGEIWRYSKETVVRNQGGGGRSGGGEVEVEGGWWWTCC